MKLGFRWQHIHLLCQTGLDYSLSLSLSSSVSLPLSVYVSVCLCLCVRDIYTYSCGRTSFRLLYYREGEWMRTQILSVSHTFIPDLPWSCTLYPPSLRLWAQAVTVWHTAVLCTDPICPCLPLLSSSTLSVGIGHGGRGQAIGIPTSPPCAWFHLIYLLRDPCELSSHTPSSLRRYKTKILKS